MTYWSLLENDEPQVAYFVVGTLNGTELDWWGPYSTKAAAMASTFYEPDLTAVVGFTGFS